MSGLIHDDDDCERCSRTIAHAAMKVLSRRAVSAHPAKTSLAPCAGPKLRCKAPSRLAPAAQIKSHGSHTLRSRQPCEPHANGAGPDWVSGEYTACVSKGAVLEDRTSTVNLGRLHLTSSHHLCFRCAGIAGCISTWATLVFTDQHGIRLKMMSTRIDSRQSFEI
jgi:hypothetical protein